MYMSALAGTCIKLLLHCKRKTYMRVAAVLLHQALYERVDDTIGLDQFEVLVLGQGRVDDE